MEGSSEFATTATPIGRRRAAHQLIGYRFAVAALDGDPELDPINGDSRPFSDWLTTFPMLVAAIDPYTHESSWLLDTVHRVFSHFRGAGVRVVWLATADPEGTRSFLGPYAEEFLPGRLSRPERLLFLLHTFDELITRDWPAADRDECQ